jgi:hypothetical protein
MSFATLGSNLAMKAASWFEAEAVELADDAVDFITRIADAWFGPAFILHPSLWGGFGVALVSHWCRIGGALGWL